MNFLHDWFPRTSVEGAADPAMTNGAVTHCPGTPGDPEILTLDLGELSKEPARITASMDTFRKKLRKWRRYNEDRDFSGDYAPAIPG